MKKSIKRSLILVAIGAIFVCALVTPAIAATWAMKYSDAAIGPESARDWFTRAGQFGDHFGFMTCCAALIAAVFTCFTYTSQRKQLADDRRRNEKADRERHFFTLYEDFKGSLEHSRLVGSESRDANVPGGAALFSRARVAAREIMGTFPSMESASEEEKILSFIYRFSGKSIFTGTNFSCCIYKFIVVYDYLDRIMDDSEKESHRLYHDILMSSMTEQEMKIIALGWTNLECNRKSPKMFLRPYIFISTYCLHVTGRVTTTQMAALVVVTNERPIFDTFAKLDLAKTEEQG